MRRELCTQGKRIVFAAVESAVHAIGSSRFTVASRSTDVVMMTRSNEPATQAFAFNAESSQFAANVAICTDFAVLMAETFAPIAGDLHAIMRSMEIPF